MLEDSDRLLATIEQVLRTGRVGAIYVLHSAPVDLGLILDECVARARAIYRLDSNALQYPPGPRVTVLGDADEVRAAVSNLIDNAVKYSGSKIVNSLSRPAECGRQYVDVRVRDRRRRHSQEDPAT